VADDSAGAETSPGGSPAAVPQLVSPAAPPLAAAGGAPAQQELLAALQPGAPDAPALQPEAAASSLAEVAAAAAAPAAVLARAASLEGASAATILKVAQELEACVHWGQLVPNSGLVRR
jgi:hypothetical protein